VADPVSWFVAEEGWEVMGSDGTKLGAVEEILGDQNEDIFDGLSVRAGALGQARYVPAELVERIVEGRIELTVSGEEFERLEESDGDLGAPRAAVDAQRKGGLLGRLFGRGS
jgi:hypothetical protein